VSRLAFMSPHEAEVGAPPLGKLEVRGGVPDGAIPIGPDRALLVVDGDPRPERDRLLAEGYRVYDMSAALDAVEVDGEHVMRRLTELDLEALPAVGAIARGTPAVIERLGADRFRLFVPTELGRFVREVVEDMR
jgi:sarcosine oxidase gamma subunit